MRLTEYCENPITPTRRKPALPHPVPRLDAGFRRRDTPLALEKTQDYLLPFVSLGTP